MTDTADDVATLIAEARAHVEIASDWTACAYIARLADALAAAQAERDTKQKVAERLADELQDAQAELDTAERNYLAQFERARAAEKALRWIAEEAGTQGCGMNECYEIARAALAAVPGEAKEQR